FANEEVKRIPLDISLARNNPDIFINPLDIIKIFKKRPHRRGRINYMVHAGIYLGKKICHAYYDQDIVNNVQVQVDEAEMEDIQNSKNENRNSTDQERMEIDNNSYEAKEILSEQDYQEICQAMIDEIKQNAGEWKIEQERTLTIIKHKQQKQLQKENNKNMVNSQEYINQKYPIDGACKSGSDKENKDKRREEIIELDLSKGKVGKGLFNNDGKTLTGSLKLERFTKLRKLIIISQQITELDVSKCENLTELDCQNNQIDILNVSGCSNLKIINCSNNHIKELDLNTCDKLEEVDISNCTELTADKIKSDLNYNTVSGKLTKVGPQVTKAGEDNIRNILIIGITGNGKSALANTLSDNDQFEEGGHSTNTNNITKEDILHEIGRGIHAAKEGINQILFVFKDRFSEEQVIVFNMFKDFIAESEITEIVTLVRTNFPNFRNPQKCEDDRKNLINESNKNLSEEWDSIHSMVDDYIRRKEEIKQNLGDTKESNEKIKQEKAGLFKELRVKLAASRGKSTLANVITGIENKFKEGSGSISETRKIQSEQFKDKESDIEYLVIDTPGIGDTKLPTKKILDIIAEAVFLVRDGVSQVFFVTNGRFDQYEMITYDLLREIIFDKDITKHTTIARTRFENFKSKNKCEEDINLMIKEIEDKKTRLESKEKEIKDISLESEQYQKLFTEVEQLKKELASTNLTEIVESCQKRIVYVNNPPIDIDDEDELELNKSILILSGQFISQHRQNS
ncbi:5344_t:CDS:2, partial [Cetraspora pellucida]